MKKRTARIDEEEVHQKVKRISSLCLQLVCLESFT